MITEKECIDCGICCYLPNAIGKTFIKNIVIIGNDGYCKHYKKNVGCDINETKPLNCKMFKKNGDKCLMLRKKYKNII